MGCCCWSIRVGPHRVASPEKHTHNIRLPGFPESTHCGSVPPSSSNKRRRRNMSDDVVRRFRFDWVQSRQSTFAVSRKLELSLSARRWPPRPQSHVPDPYQEEATVLIIVEKTSSNVILSQTIEVTTGRASAHSIREQLGDGAGHPLCRSR
jgi:hypothetical protein